MDVIEIARRRDLAALETALRENPTVAATRNADNASLFSFLHYLRWTEAIPLVRAALPELSPHEAVIAGDEERLRAALAAGWDPNERSSDGFSPIALAAFFGREAMFDLLLPLTHDLNERSSNPQKVAALHAAAASRSNGIVEKLLRAGANPDLQQQDGFTALHAAAQHGDAVIAGLLLLFDADRDIPTAHGDLPRELAERAGHHWLAARL